MCQLLTREIKTQRLQCRNPNYTSKAHTSVHKTHACTHTHSLSLHSSSFVESNESRTKTNDTNSSNQKLQQQSENFVSKQTWNGIKQQSSKREWTIFPTLHGQHSYIHAHATLTGKKEREGEWSSNTQLVRQFTFELRAFRGIRWKKMWKIPTKI